MNENTIRTATAIMALAVLGFAGFRIHKQLDRRKPAAEQSQPSGDTETEPHDGGMAGEPGDLTPPAGPDGTDFVREHMRANQAPERFVLSEQQRNALREHMRASQPPERFVLSEQQRNALGSPPGFVQGTKTLAMPEAVQGTWVLHPDRSVNLMKQVLAKKGKPMPPRIETGLRQVFRTGQLGETRVIGPKGITILLHDPTKKVRQDWATQVLSVTPQRVRVRITRCRVQELSGTEPDAETWEQQYPGKVLDIVHTDGFMRFEPSTPMKCAVGVFSRK